MSTVTSYEHIPVLKYVTIDRNSVAVNLQPSWYKMI